MTLADACNPVVIIVGRDEVQSGTPKPTLDALRRFSESPDVARSFCERVDVAFHGYDDDPRELWEIPEVRQFVHLLDEQFPFWLFFLSKQGSGLQCLLLCMLPPFLTPEAQGEVFPERMGDLLSRRWLPAMNEMCDYSAQEPGRRLQLTRDAEDYILKGRTPPES
jgi:hypothetical protein